MASKGLKRFPTHHGHGDVGVSRYFVLYVAQAGWFVLGFYLYSVAYWPSSCQPSDLVEVYACSPHLPSDGGGWREAALLTWLWATPILIALEISRRVNRSEG
ncbi:hypothetical protein [Aurantiacibacter aquimixticola]|uniref:Uncharacterized protein n=1 Tax=Aurantiacibacter aquimixticola TaxID=1958945 RepID=A0A419RU91_9SPHN|nr:hypothetical protein [Aurantiacibacter aquimixticola]RJY09358.1 hypothetical protein D6201_08320 [Aurantiacibacter aquimixticola]